MRRLVGLVAALAVVAAPVAFAAPAQAAAFGNLVDNGNGTVTVTYGGLGSPPVGNLLFCESNISPASCGFGNYTYLMGGFGVALPATGTLISAGNTVRARSTSSTTVLPDGTYTMRLTDGVPATLATLSNAVIGSGSTPSGGSNSSAPAPIVQQFGMPATGTCDAAQPEGLDWSGVSRGGWGVSWAQWMHGGNGGAVCTRTLVYSTAQAKWIVG